MSTASPRFDSPGVMDSAWIVLVSDFDCLGATCTTSYMRASREKTSDSFDNCGHRQLPMGRTNCVLKAGGGGWFSEYFKVPATPDRFELAAKNLARPSGKV